MSGARSRKTGLLFLALIFSAIPARAAQPATAASPTTQTTRTIRRRVATLATIPKPGNSVPGVVALDAAQKRIREIYASDYTDTSFSARRALAQRMIEASDQTRHDTEVKFALLREARDVAAGAGDVPTAFEAVDHLAAAFPVVKLSERIEVLKVAVPVLAANPARIAAVSICMDLVDQCVVEGDYDRARLLLSFAEDLSRQARSLPDLNWTQSRSAALQPFVAAYELARPAEAKLSNAPDDPQANLVMGKFVAFVRGDIDAGLNMLAKGSDHELAALAEKDLDTPDAAPDQFKTANAWWDFSNSQEAEMRDAMRRRSGFWYRKAVGGLDGLDRVLANRRIQEASPMPKPGQKKEHPPDALKLTAAPPHWYRVSIAEVSWEAAQQLCQESGAQLCCIETRVESDLMTKLARGRTLWLGATFDSDGNWTWTSGGPFFFVNWSPGEPANVIPQSHIATGFDGMWHIQSAKTGFIYEWSE